MCGPFCSVPPVGMMMVVLPAAMASRTSIHVSSSRNTLPGCGSEGACANAGDAQASARSVNIFTVFIAMREMICLSLPHQWASPLRRSTASSAMPAGDKDKYTDKQKRQAEHIEEGYEKRGVPEEEAERRAWATVNKVHHGGEKPGGGGYGRPENHEPMRRGGKKR